MSGEAGPALSRLALFGRCPRCGEGRLFAGLLALRPNCPACGLDFSAHDAGDGPAVAGVFLVGTIAVIGAIILDVKLRPALWVHAVIWPLVVLPLSILVMRVAKALLVALHYRRVG